MREIEPHEPEVVDELAFRALRANSHHREVGRHLSYALDHAIACGEELEAAFQSLPHGEWEPWLAENFEGGRSTAYEYRRFARNKAKLNVHDRGHLSLAEARRILSPPKDEEHEDGRGDEGKQRGAPSTRKTVDDGPKVKIGGKDYDAKGMRELVKELRKDKRELEAETERLREAEEQDRREYQERIDMMYSAEMANLKAKYGDVEEPRFAHVPPEEWERQIREAKSARVIEVAKHIRELYGWPEWMGRYWPEEAADAIADMVAGRDDMLNGWNFIIGWMGQVRDALEERGLRDPYEKWK